jgi:hypothetical protein
MGRGRGQATLRTKPSFVRCSKLDGLPRAPEDHAGADEADRRAEEIPAIGHGLALKRTLLHTSRAGIRDVRDRRGSGRSCRCGDAPPSPWPSQGVVDGLWRLYGYVGGLARGGSYGGVESLRLRDFCNLRDRNTVPVETTQPVHDTLRRPRGRRGVSAAAMPARSSPISDVTNPSTRCV